METGIFRVHQFEKVEQFVICENDLEKSNAIQEEMIKAAEVPLLDIKDDNIINNIISNNIHNNNTLYHTMCVGVLPVLGLSLPCNQYRLWSS